MAPKAHSRGGGHALRIIRNVYLYLVAMIGLIVFVVGTVGLVNNVLENYVFQVDEDRYYAVPLDGGVCSKYYVRPGSDEQMERTDEEIAECEQQVEEQNRKNRENNIKRELASSISSIVVGLPLWLLHWGIIQTEYSRKKKRLLAKK